MGEDVTILAPPRVPSKARHLDFGGEERAGMGCWRSRVSRKYLFHNAVVVVLQDQGQDGI